MAVTWGLVSGSSEYGSKEEFLDQWKLFCKMDFSRHFVVLFDDVFYKFEKFKNEEIQMTSCEDPELLAKIKSFRISDGTYDQFGWILTESIDIFVPELPGDVMEAPQSWGFKNRLLVYGLARLWRMDVEDIDESARELAAQLRDVADFCQDHRLLLRISWGSY